jgi:hypothetical protein
MQVIVNVVSILYNTVKLLEFKDDEMGKPVEGGFERFVRFEMHRYEVAAGAGVPGDSLTNLDVLKHYAGPGGEVEISRRHISDAATEYNRWLERQFGERVIQGPAELVGRGVVGVVISRHANGLPIPETEALWTPPEKFVGHMEKRAAEGENPIHAESDRQIVAWLHAHVEGLKS